MSMTNVLRSILYDGNSRSLKVLNQLLLPHKEEYVDVKDSNDGYDVIKKMIVRGAPAIAMVAILSLAVELADKSFDSPEECTKYIESRLDYLYKSRPTAVNLGDAVKKAKEVARNAALDSAADIVLEYAKMAEIMLEEDIRTNERIGKHGSTLFEGKDLEVVTICNTGSLATAGYGTALGVIRSLHADGKLGMAWALETRPYLQGARLTAYELVADGIPGTLITDSMAAALMKTRKIAGVVVGADRVAANGDTANKIGTYQLAVVAKYHGVKFYVAAPTTSIDLHTATGADIPIETRADDELREVQGVSIAPEINVWNPAFDVTDSSLIDGIITENGVVLPQNGVFDMRSVCSS
ncbi:hypothetical protein CANCADRAFT_148312 [Tortispora caseinolytica NRRL Y-17796]|uniref:Methylthioribose-1-phosphate isomerase n=1 Tax=Tortispora caseinolytica NRRL Y-17796 TaxID=767744 RepID=A0A1E4TA32_9ASCO|nr:hypothetical protein CANCADRAFT_148312 [Tortispora caseinolytica NRRL Y-17796]